MILIRNMFPQIKLYLLGSHLQDYEGELISYYIQMKLLHRFLECFSILKYNVTVVKQVGKLSAVDPQLDEIYFCNKVS